MNEGNGAMKLSLKFINGLFLFGCVIILNGCYSRGQHPRMPDISPGLVPVAFSNATDILVLPLWEVIPHFYTDTQYPLYLVSSPFVAPGLQYVVSDIKRPDYWSIATPGSRIGNKFQILRGIYLILNSGDVVWLSTTMGYKNWWSYIKWATMHKEWRNEIETAIEKGKAWRSGESNSTFWGADYKVEMKIKVELTFVEKKMVGEYLDSINYEKITNGGQWKLMFNDLYRDRKGILGRTLYGQKIYPTGNDERQK